MENQHKLCSEMNESLPSDDELVYIYSGIEAAARNAVVNGKIIGNPILAQKDARYGISVDALTIGSVAHPFLVSVLSQVKNVEPTAICIAPDDLHMTQEEVYFSNKGRVIEGKALIDAQRLRHYYDAVKNNLSDFDPIRLRIFRIMPTLDFHILGDDQRSMAIVAAFLTDSDSQIHKLRRGIKDSVEKEGLETQSRLGVSRVLFVSMARLTQPPKINNDMVPLLQVIDEINRNSLSTLELTIDKIYARSTSTISYLMPKGYITLDPPIPLRKDQRSYVSPKFVRPSQFQPK